ncbi:unnamed protein product [Linum trigynum]|uniref:Uncharacterized protein n=1 Tax=Linum trigynum TaxID=586398 RepID=A0AAV2CTG0_9ROSI
MSSSSSPADFEVSVKEISIPAITLSSPWITAARCALVSPMTQNCSFLHNSSSMQPHPSPPPPPHRPHLLGRRIEKKGEERVWISLERKSKGFFLLKGRRKEKKEESRSE